MRKTIIIFAHPQKFMLSKTSLLDDPHQFVLVKCKHFADFKTAKVNASKVTDFLEKNTESFLQT